MIEFSFSRIRSDRLKHDNPADIFIGVSADFQIVSNGRPIYSETDFPVVELAADLADWLTRGNLRGDSFEFDSMSTPEPGWVWIRRSDAGWRVGSLHQDRADVTVWEDGDIRAAVTKFIGQVKKLAADEIGIDVGRHIGPSKDSSAGRPRDHRGSR